MNILLMYFIFIWIYTVDTRNFNQHFVSNSKFRDLKNVIYTLRSIPGKRSLFTIGSLFKMQNADTLYGLVKICIARRGQCPGHFVVL